MAPPITFFHSGAQRIFLFLDRKTKDPTGDATVTFQSPESAKKAIDQFDQTDFNGHGMITVKQASPDQKNPFAEMLVSIFVLVKTTFDSADFSVVKAKRIRFHVHLD